MLFDKKFNEKTHFKFIKNLLKIKNDKIVTSYDEYEEYFYSGKIKDENNVICLNKFKRLCYIWTLKDDFKFDNSSIKHLLLILTGSKEPMINPYLYKELLLYIEHLRQEFSIEKVKEFFIGMIRYNSFYDYTYEMSSILMNFLMYQNNQPVIVFYMYYNKINEYIQEEKIDRAYDLLNLLFLENVKYHIKREYKTRKEVIKSLEIIKKNLIGKGVNQVYLYGSYAKGTNSLFSDVDIYLEIDDKYQSNTTSHIKNRFIELERLLIDITLSTEVNNDYKKEIFKHAIRI